MNQDDLYTGREQTLVNFILRKYLERFALIMLRERRHICYDDLWIAALSEPLTWESDLKGWIRQWQFDGRLSIEGMKAKQKYPTVVSKIS